MSDSNIPIDECFSQAFNALAESLRHLAEAWSALTPAEMGEYVRRMDERILGEVKTDAS